MNTTKTYRIWFMILMLSFSVIATFAQDEPVVGLMRNEEGVLEYLSRNAL